MAGPPPATSCPTPTRFRRGTRLINISRRLQQGRKALGLLLGMDWITNERIYGPLCMIPVTGQIMVLILDGNSLSSAHRRSYGTIVRKEFVLLNPTFD